jgi:hypothetical protein
MEDKESLASKVNSLIDSLLNPLSPNEISNGWSEARQTAIRSSLDDLRTKLLRNERIPYFGIVRALDHWGITGGDLFQKAAEIDYGLRHLK